MEAPQGPLIHHYLVENGLIARAEFIIPTVHNVLAIEQASRVVRAFDPCIACATH